MKFQFGSIDLRATPTRRELIIFGFVLVAAGMGFFRSYFVPNVNTISILNDQKLALVQQRDQLAKLAHVPQGVSKMLGKPKGEIQQLIFGSEKEMRLALDQWTRSSLLRGIKVTGSKLSDVEKKGKLLRMNVELHVEGSFAGVGRYIEKLELPPAPLAIQSISITSVSDRSSRVHSAIVGSVYAMEP